jgi:hypothetical protein
VATKNRRHSLDTIRRCACRLSTIALVWTMPRAREPLVVGDVCRNATIPLDSVERRISILEWSGAETIPLRTARLVDLRSLYRSTLPAARSPLTAYSLGRQGSNPVPCPLQVGDQDFHRGHRFAPGIATPVVKQHYHPVVKG